MKPRTKFSSELQQEHELQQQQTNQQTAREFATAEELLRFDSANTLVPPEIARRLQESSASSPQPKRSWLRRLFGS
jgi:hypothetical protein